MKLSKRRQALIDDYALYTRGYLEFYVRTAGAMKLGAWHFQPGRPIANYDGGGDRHEYDSISLLLLPNGVGRIERILPCRLDACQVDIVTEVEWIQTVQQIVWAIREDAMQFREHGLPFKGNEYVVSDKNYIPNAPGAVTFYVPKI